MNDLDHRERVFPGPLGSMTLAAACTVFIVLSCFEILRVEGTSMEPTIRDGQTVVVFRLAYGLRLGGRLGIFAKRYLLEWKEVGRNDIIVFEHPVSGDEIVKRCIGVAGDPVRSNGAGYEMLDEQSVPSAHSTRIPAGKLYVAGDKPEASFDSRHFGMVAASSVHGRVVFPVTKRNSTE